MKKNRDAEEIIDLYRRHAKSWAARRSQSLQEKSWLDRFLQTMPLRPHILDLGCGSGAPMARYLLDQGADLQGVDSAPEMIEMAQTSLPKGRWHVADMRGLDLGQRFDGVLAWNSFFHLSPEEQRQMFRVFRDHIADNGALMFTSGTHDGVAMGCLEGERLYHASLDPQEYRDLLNSHGFEVADHVVEDPDCGRHTVWLARRVKE